MNGNYARKLTHVFFGWAMLGAVGYAEEMQVYFGNLHAHSNASDGNKDISPAEAYRIAREEGKLDFLSLSEHNHIMKNQETYEGVMQAAEQATTGGFVALFGQEYSTINKGFNHTNIHNYPLRIPKSMNGKYGEIFGNVLPSYSLQHPETVIFAGFNHPKKLSTDYGLEKDYDGDWSRFVEDMDPFVQLIAVASGPADASKKKKYLDPAAHPKFVHQNISHARWFAYLARGMHLAPKIDHDSHSPTYGFRHAGRTAVWASGGLTRDKLLAALAARHCYATEDLNLKIVAAIGTHRLPGDVIGVTDDGSWTLQLTISDPDEPDAEYTAEVFAGVTGDGVIATKVEDLAQSWSGDGSITFSLSAELDASLYYVVHVRQTSDDPINGEGKQDAWLAPIWLDGTVDQEEIDDDIDNDVNPFVSSKRSKVYHFAECRIALTIKDKNRIEHASQPAEKRLHKGCPWD